MGGRLWTEEEIQILTENYKQYGTMKLIKTLFPDRKPKSIRDKASKCGLTDSSRRGNQYVHNKFFFANPDPLSAYWAGFIAADGWVIKDINKLGIELNSKDRNHLETFISDIDFTGNIYDRNRITINGNLHSLSSIHICGASQIINDLKRHYNITPAKTKTLLPPNITDEILLKCYLIGYIDGDGCIGVKKETLRLSMAGTEPWLLFFKARFDKWYPERVKEVNIHINGSSFQLDLAGKRVVTILTDLSTYNLPVLRRKWDKVSKYI